MTLSVFSRAFRLLQAFSSAILYTCAAFEHRRESGLNSGGDAGAGQKTWLGARSGVRRGKCLGCGWAPPQKMIFFAPKWRVLVNSEQRFFFENLGTIGIGVRHSKLWTTRSRFPRDLRPIFENISTGTECRVSCTDSCYRYTVRK